MRQLLDFFQFNAFRRKSSQNLPFRSPKRVQPDVSRRRIHISLHEGYGFAPTEEAVAVLYKPRWMKSLETYPFLVTRRFQNRFQFAREQKPQNGLNLPQGFPA